MRIGTELCLGKGVLKNNSLSKTLRSVDSKLNKEFSMKCNVDKDDMPMMAKCKKVEKKREMKEKMKKTHRKAKS